MTQVPIVIPAYQPGETLVLLVQALLDLGVGPIIVVDDGSGPEFRSCFERARASRRVHVIHHAANLGKGAALKTGMNHALVHFPACAGIVTGDADGQHAPEDIARVADALDSNPNALTMGVREFGRTTPLRSRLGNSVTRVLMRFTLGEKLADSQTGLRGIPASMLPHLLRLPSSGYEYELDMLIAAKHHGCPIDQLPIRTIYVEGNKSSHFQPVVDSMRIYFVLFRFALLAVLTAGIDNAVFIAAFALTGSIARSQVAGRLVAMTVNYLGARTSVFHSQQLHAVLLPRYVSLVFCNGFISYLLIEVMHSRIGLSAIKSKLIAEGLLFIANFALQRDFVFSRPQAQPAATDWDSYYKSAPFTAKLTRRYTTRVLLKAIRSYCKRQRIAIVEIGGANSCFLDAILHKTQCGSYDVVDTSEYGLSLLARKSRVRLHHQSVFALALDIQADLVFSVGLVEHFDSRETREAILAHFTLAQPGGTVIITFPTPTLLYRVTRRLIEFAGMWKFPDERPLAAAEVLATIREHADVLHQKTLWPLLLTQKLIVARKRAANTHEWDGPPEPRPTPPWASGSCVRPIASYMTNFGDTTLAVSVAGATRDYSAPARNRA